MVEKDLYQKIRHAANINSRQFIDSLFIDNEMLSEYNGILHHVSIMYSVAYNRIYQPYFNN